MTNGLTQKERMMLQDGLKHEEVCVWKYRDHAARLSDPAAKTMLVEIANEELAHYNTLSQFLGEAQQSAEHKPAGFRTEVGMEAQPVPQVGTSYEMGPGTPTGAAPQGRQAEPTAESLAREAAKAADALLLSDLLMMEKFVSGTYDTAIFEMQNSQIRQALQQIQKDEQKHGERIYNHMRQAGMYGTRG